MTNQKEIPSVAGNVIPEYVSSFKQYKNEIIEKYSLDLSEAGAHECLLYKDWVNSRGVILRFDRKAIEIRIMDEQECVKSDVALSCFIRALLRGLIREKTELLLQEILVKDFDSVVSNGLKANILNPNGKIARHVCQSFLRIALENASKEEKKYLPIIQKRIEYGSLSEVIRERVRLRTQKTDFEEALLDVYSKLLSSLRDNQQYF